MIDYKPVALNLLKNRATPYSPFLKKNINIVNPNEDMTHIKNNV